MSTPHTALLAATLLGAVGCSKPAMVDSAAEGAHSNSSFVDSGAPWAEGHVLSGVGWTLQTNHSGLTQLASGGWRLQRDDGAELEVDEAWLVVYVVTLETCTDAAESTRTAPPPPHGLPDHASATAVSYALGLHTADPVDAGTYRFEPDAFCQVGIALFRGDTVTENTPSGTTLDGVTLHLDGRMRAGPSADWQPLALRSSLGAEADLVLGASVISDPAAITVAFHPANLLEGVELGDDPDRIAFSMLKNLAATAAVHPDPPPEIP